MLGAEVVFEFQLPPFGHLLFTEGTLVFGLEAEALSHPFGSVGVVFERLDGPRHHRASKHTRDFIPQDGQVGPRV